MGYQVHRSPVPGFSPSASTLVASTAGSSLVDSGVLAGVWYYKVLAVDAAGNLSTTSQTVGVTVTDTTPPTQPGSFQAVAGAGTVALSWTASTDDSGQVAYDVYRSATSGFAPSPASLLTSVTGTSYVDTPSLGTWYYRVVARDGAGNVSAPTPQASASQSDSIPPTQPGNPATSVSGSSVTVSWTASTDNTGVVAYDVYRSATSGFTPSGAPLASTAALSYVDATAPQGTSYYRIIARDGAGNPSPASAEVSAVVAATPTVVTLSPVADAYANAGAPTTNYGSDSSLASRGTPGAVSFLRFALPATPVGKALSSAVLKIRSTTDPNAGSIEPHTVRVASDAWTESTLTWNTRPATGTTVLGTIGAPTVVNTAYSTSLDATALAGAVANPSVGGNVSVSVTNAGTDSLYFWSSNAATVANRPSLVLTYTASDSTPPTQPGNLQAVATSPNVALSWTASTDASGPVSYQVHRSSTSGFTPSPATLVATTSALTYTDTTAPVGTSYYVVVARDVANNPSTPSAEASAVVTDVVAPSQPSGLSASISGSDVTVSWSPANDNVGVTSYDVYRGTTVGFVADGSTLLGSTPSVSYLDAGRPNGVTFYYRVVARDLVGNASTPSAAYGVTVGDSTPPSQPGMPTAVPSGSSVALSWAASTDNVAVTAYEVHRSASTGFTPSPATLIATTAATSYTNTSVPNGTWYYVIVARDAANNPSMPSGQASATIAAAPTVVTLNPVADTYANAGATATNYGTSSTLMSRGSIGAVSYLRFTVPAAPAGKTLTGATLTFRTTTDVNAGSLETHTVSVASNTWDELTLTWANKPAITGPVAGTIAAGTAVSTAYVTTLDPSALAPFVGAQGTLSITNTGTDSLYFWSSNSVTASYRPLLTLTFS